MTSTRGPFGPFDHISNNTHPIRGVVGHGGDATCLRATVRVPTLCEDELVRREIKYVELKSGFNDDGPASISWVTFSKTGRTVHYRGRSLQRIIRGGVNSNHYDVETGEEYWISGVKRNGEDRHWAGKGTVEIDDDAREEYERIIGHGAKSP